MVMHEKDVQILLNPKILVIVLLDLPGGVCYNSVLRRGVEQWQLVGLITRRS